MFKSNKTALNEYWKFSQAKYIPTLYPSFAQLNEKM